MEYIQTLIQTLANIQFSDILRIVWKELRVAILCGLALAVINMAKLVFSLFPETDVLVSGEETEPTIVL